MRRTNLNGTPLRWLMALAVLAVLSSVATGFAKQHLAAADVYLPMRLANPGADCRMHTSCDPAGFAGACCEWGAGMVLATAGTEIAPSDSKNDRSPPFTINSKNLPETLAYANRRTFKPDKTYSASAGTETYLATARLRI
ncbi:MAG: hypothetical protein HYX63_05975 [Gammaproteobacteria bacterium]|nr:hypothetical protein [Gammaproteobacteria bacterium]